MTLNLSEAKNHGCRPHPRGSVRRASGFVLTGKPEVIRGFTNGWLRIAGEIRVCVASDAVCSPYLRAPTLCEVPRHSLKSLHRAPLLPYPRGHT